MKKALILAANLLIISTLSFAQDLPTADAVVDKYLTAIGGKDAIAKISDMTINTNTEMGQMTMETESKYKFPGKYRQSTYMMGNEGRLVISDGTKVYSKQPARGNRPEQIDTKEGKDAQAEIFMTNPFAETMYAQANIKGVVQGIEQVDGKDAYKVEFTSPDDKKWTDFFDKDSGLKVKRMATMKTPRGENTSTATFKDYKEVGGVKIPYSVSRSFGERDLKMDIQSVKVNKGLKDGDFVIKP